MDKRIHFIQVQLSKFGNQLKKLTFLILFLKNSMILNKGKYCKFSGGILKQYTEEHFYFRLLVHLDTFISSFKVRER